MVDNIECRACGEKEDIDGTAEDGGIRLHCQRCDARWLRGAPTCRTCGGSEAIVAQQAVTRLPRGSLRAIVGMREVPLCPACDAVVLTTVARNHHVPEDYLSQFLRRPPTECEPARATPTPPPFVTSPPPRAAQRATPEAASSAPARPAREDPAVHMAIARYLTHAGSAGSPADPVTLIQLGTFLGPSTRLSRVDVDAFPEWVERTWPSAGARQRVLATVRSILAYWTDQHWLPPEARNPPV